MWFQRATAPRGPAGPPSGTGVRLATGHSGTALRNARQSSAPTREEDASLRRETSRDSQKDPRPPKRLPQPVCVRRRGRRGSTRARGAGEGATKLETALGFNGKPLPAYTAQALSSAISEARRRRKTHGRERTQPARTSPATQRPTRRVGAALCERTRTAPGSQPSPRGGFATRCARGDARPPLHGPAAPTRPWPGRPTLPCSAAVSPARVSPRASPHRSRSTAQLRSRQ